MLLQSGVDETWWAGSMECYCYLRNVKELLADGEHLYETRFGETFKGQVFLLGAMVEYYPISARVTNLARSHQFGKKVLPGVFLDRWKNLERRYSGGRHGRIGEDKRIRKSMHKDSMQTKCSRSARGPKSQGPRAGRRIGRVVPRAEHFSNLITADHKVLSEGCDSRNNHRYAVVVQDLETQWLHSYPFKTKTSQETEKSLQKFLEPNRKPKVIFTDISLEFGEACEELSWRHCTWTRHRSETIGTAERAVRRVIEGTSAVLLQSGLDEKW